MAPTPAFLIQLHPKQALPRIAFMQTAMKDAAMPHYSKQADAMDRHLYMAHRMDLAFERLRQHDNPQARARCAQWVTAWAVAAGADAPRGMKLRIRGEFVLL